MAELKVKTRQTGATATVGRTGLPHVTSVTGGEIDIVTSPSQPGFNPLDLLYSSLSACLVLSARMAASSLGVLDKLTEVTAVVTGEKATEGLSRVEKWSWVQCNTRPGGGPPLPLLLCASSTNMGMGASKRSPSSATQK